MVEDATSQTLAVAEYPNPKRSQDLVKPATFHRFSNPPQEMQNLTWGSVETEPRIIIKKYESGGIYFAAPYGPRYILYVSSKARAEGPKRFWPVLTSGIGREARYYHVDFSRDIFLLQSSRKENMGASEWASSI